MKRCNDVLAVSTLEVQREIVVVSIELDRNNRPNLFAIIAPDKWEPRESFHRASSYAN